MFFRPLRDLAEKYNILQNAMASAERIFLVLDTANPMPQPAPRPGDAPLGPVEELRFEDVDFGYLPGERVLKDVSFAVRRGETVAVVGPTGAGKTSLVNLIPRLYDPTGGRVLINGRDLRTDPERRVPRPHGAGHAGRLPVLGHHPRKHLPGRRVPGPRRRRRGRGRLQPRPADRAAARGPRHPARRGRGLDLHRRAPADRHRPGLRPRPRAHPVRRGHLRHRLPDRAAGSRRRWRG